MHILFLTLTIIFSFTVSANSGPQPKVEMDFVMERDAQDAWDTRVHRSGLAYGEKFSARSFRYGSDRKTHLTFFLQKQGPDRALKFSICILKGSFFSSVGKKVQFIKSPEIEKTCNIFETIEFQFNPNELVVIPSKVELNSRYKILISEY